MPVVIRTPGVQISPDSGFDVHAKAGSEKRKRQSPPQVIEGSTSRNPSIGYDGVEDQTQKYCLVLKDQTTGKLEIVDTQLFDVKSYVKSLRQQDMETAIRQSGVKNWQQRTALGEAFGTKKAKTAINDISRNRLEADMLEGLESAIVDNVQDRTAHLPSAEQRQQAAEAERPIPPYNSETNNTAEIYPLENIVPVSEMDLVMPIVDEVMTASAADRLEKLPFGKSDFINARVENVLSDDSNIRPRLQVLVYLSFLRAVYENRRVTNRQSLVERVGEYPQELYDGVLQRFTVSRAGRYGQSKDRSFVFDPYHTDKLLCYMLALCLHANDFEADVTPLAHELSTKASKVVTLFRNLGCVARTASAADAKARDLTPSQASSYRIAVLNAPLSLPDIVKRKRV